jgi:hypothetical protein
VAHRHAREVAELHGLLDQREGTRDQRLRRDHGRRARQHHERDGPATARHHAEERVVHLLGVAQEQRALAEVREHERGPDQRQPAAPDRLHAEVAHVGVERLDARDHEHDRAEHPDAVPAVRREEDQRVVRQQRVEDVRVIARVPRAERGERREPHQHHRPEQPADHTRAPVLEREQPEQQCAGDRHDERLERLRRDLEALDRAQHRDRRGDHALAAQERRTEQRHERHRADAHTVRRAQPLGHQREQREDPALAAVVRAHHEQQVLARDHERERPDDERQHAQQVLAALHEAVVGVDALLERVEGTRTDVAEDHAERGECEQHFSPNSLPLRVCHQR